MNELKKNFHLINGQKKTIAEIMYQNGEKIPKNGLGKKTSG